MKIILSSLICTLGLSAFAGSDVYFTSPKDQATVPSTFTVKMGIDAKKLKLCPAGQCLDDKKSGHFHVIVDGPATPEGTVIPADATHIHYGKAQTEGELKLAPGPHTLTLVFADGVHRSYGPTESQTIHITVK